MYIDALYYISSFSGSYFQQSLSGQIITNWQNQTPWMLIGWGKHMKPSQNILSPFIHGLFYWSQTKTMISWLVGDNLFLIWESWELFHIHTLTLPMDTSFAVFCIGKIHWPAFYESLARLLGILAMIAMGVSSLSPFPTWYQWPFQDPKLEVPTIYKAYFWGLCKRIPPQNMAKHMVQYLHFRILEFPLMI